MCVLLLSLGGGGRMSALSISQFTTSHLGMAEGMHSQRIYSICQTPDGALWWSVKGGAERYNGAVIQHYPLAPDDRDGQWGGLKLLIRYTGGRLCAFDNEGNYYLYNAVLDRFELSLRLARLLRVSVQIFDVHIDARRGTFLATDRGLYVMHAGRLTALHTPRQVNCIATVGGRLCFGGTDGLWAIGGLQLSAAGSRVRLTRLSRHNVESIHDDAARGRLWVGTFNQGLRLLDAGGRELPLAPTVASMPHNPVRSIIAYDGSTLLAGVDGFGVYAVRRDGTGASLLADANSGPQGVLHGNGIYAIHRDSWGNVIIGSYSGGIDVLRPVGSTAAIITRESGNPQSLGNDHVNAITPLPDGGLIMGTDNGISICDIKGSRWRHLLHGTVVLDICRMPDGTILAATYGRGVWQLSADGTARQRYSVAEGTLQTDYVFSLTLARDGTLYMGCLNAPMVGVGPRGRQTYAVSQIQQVVELPDGTLMAGTTYGLVAVDPHSGLTRTVEYGVKGGPAPNRYILDLCVGPRDQLWIATDGGGVYVLDLHTARSRQITTRDGLPSGGAVSLFHDGRGRMWVGTDHGMAYVDDRGRVTNVSFCNGLEREYCFKAVAPLRGGQVIFGSTSGAVIINPTQIQGAGIDVRLNLRRIVVRDGQTASDGRTARLHEMLAQGRVELSYGQRTFDLYVEGINLRNQFDVVYTYRMGDGTWSQPTAQQSIRFTNLEPGHHRLTLRCLSKSTGRVLDEARLTIEIAEPWWNSWWMWTIYLLALAAVFWGAWAVYQLHVRYMRLSVELANQSNESQTEGHPAAPAVAPGHRDESAEPCRPTGAVTSEAPAQPMTQPAAEPCSLAAEDSCLPAPGGAEPAEAAETHPADRTSEADSAPAAEQLDSTFLNQTTRTVVAHLGDAQFTIDRLCLEMGMSRTLFYIRLKSLTGKSPQDFIRVIRLERASRLLREGHSVADAAAMTGFDNTKYFSTVFKKYFGVPPSKYKE